MKIYQFRPAAFASARAVACFPAESPAIFPNTAPAINPVPPDSFSAERSSTSTEAPCSAAASAAQSAALPAPMTITSLEEGSTSTIPKASLDADVGVFRELDPFRSFVLDEVRKFGRRPATGIAADVAEPRRDFR